jgi:glycosidase
MIFLLTDVQLSELLIGQFMENNKLIIAEINTWVWLNEVETQFGRPFSLETIPSRKWDELAELGFTAIWLMGVWKRSPLGRKISRENSGLYEEYSNSLPDWQMNDLPGSPYCVKEYSVDPRFGGNKALAIAREELARRGMKLLLDFVPNHIALDHKWVKQYPEYLIKADEMDLLRNPRDYFQTENGIFANGRDPFFPPWQDVAQLNAFSSGYRYAAAEVLENIGKMCDGVRCDMAMLMLNRVFSYIWQSRAGEIPATEFWSEIIPQVHKRYPEMLFLAEAYWGLEWDLQQLGFDYCYDKRLYDRLIQENAETIRQHLSADIQYQSHLVRFIENHDEERAAARLSIQQLKAASVITATLPGATLLYEGQWEGRKSRNHVLLGRRQPEPVNTELKAFYKTLLSEVRKIPIDASWQMCEIKGWEDNQTCNNLIAYIWTSRKRKAIIIVNYSDHSAQGKIRLHWGGKMESTIELHDLFGKDSFIRESADLIENGLFVDLSARGFHYFSVLG